MKYFLFILIFILPGTQGYAQSLSGTWKGNFVTYHSNSVFGDYTSVTLQFLPVENDRYVVLSHARIMDAKGKERTIESAFYYQLIGNDSLYLEEKEVLQSEDSSGHCLQKMALKIFRKKKKTILSGLWESTSKECDEYGKIYFRRKDN